MKSKYLTLFHILPYLFLFPCASSQYKPVTLQDLGNLEDYSFVQCTGLYQDSTGLLWISTFKGIDRWDGSRITAYPYFPFDSTAFPGRTGRAWCRDKQNNLWCSGAGLIRFDLELETFHTHSLIYEDEELAYSRVSLDPSGFLWLGSSQGIFKYYPEKDSLKYIPVLTSDSSEFPDVRGIEFLYDTCGTCWMADMAHGIFSFDESLQTFIHHPIELPSYTGQPMYIVDMKKDLEGNFWIMGLRGELCCYNPYSHTYEWHKLPLYKKLSPTVTGGMAVDHRGRIWFGVDMGLMLYDPVSKILTRMNDPEEPIMIMDMLTDIHGNIVIATLQGVRLIDPWDTRIRVLQLRTEMRSEGSCWITSVSRNEEWLWIGTYGRGIIRYNLETGHYRYYEADGNPGSLSTNHIMRILKDAEGGIWIMQAGGYLCKYDPQQDHFVDPQRTPSDFILKQGNDLFCLLGEDHLLRFDPISLDTIRIAFEKPLPVMNGLRSLLDLGSFIMDKKGNYWFGQQDGGLYCIDPKSGKWMHCNYDPDNPDGLPDVHVMNLYGDSRGTIWVSTFSGLSRIVPDSTSDIGFSFDNSYVTEKHLGRTIRVIEDLHGNIYAGSFSGLHIFKADGSYEFYTRHNGLPENADIRIWALEVDSQSGEIYFGSEDLLILPHDFLYPVKPVPEIILTDMYIGGKRVPPGKDMPLKKSIFFVDRLELKHKQNFLQFEFSALSSSHYKTNRYRYILEGIDMDTIEAGTKNFAEYTDLSPGKYRFWVTGASHNGPWNPEGRSIDILIQPPWYGSSTARSGYLIGLLLLVLGFVRIRTTKLRKEKLLLAAQVAKRTAELRQKNEKIVEMERLKTRFFTDVSHEIRTPLSLISGPLDVLLKQEYGNQNTHKHLGVIKRNSQRLVHLINQLLDISRLDSGQMKLILEETDIMHHLKVLANEYQSLAEKNHICFITDIQQSIGKVWNDGDKIEKALTNLLSNAFKFTPEFGTITFRAKILYESGKQEIPFLRIIVADTGIGIHEEEKEKVFDRFYRSKGQEHNNSSGTGIGLSLTREMVRLLKGDIRVKSLVGKGTVFITTLPLGFHHLAENEYILKKEEASGGRTDVSTPEPKELHTRRTFKSADITVLIVEDNKEVRTFIKEVLEPEYLILQAGDGLQGYELAVSNLPDLIISDIMMPGLDGNVLCEKLKNDERTCHIPIIMLTARATTHDKIEGLECGADDYIFKPFRMEEVRARIINLLEQRERLRSKYSEYIGIDWSNMTVSTLDEQFLKKITETVAENLHDFSFNVGVLQDRMAMSESTLYKKLKALTGDSPSQLIRIMRLKYAASLLQKNDLSITEILMSAGFSNPSYFSRCFRAYFGMTPKAYQKSVSHSV